MKVHLKQRESKKTGKISLYLEIYNGTSKTPDGKSKILRDYEYLKLYLYKKPKNSTERESNKGTLYLAESIKAKRELEIRNGIYGFANTFKQNANFIDYINSLAEKRVNSKGNYGNWDSTIKHLVAYSGSQFTFKDIDDAFCEGFKDYLINKAFKQNGEPLASSSTSSYFSKFRATLKQAVKDKVILTNPSEGIETPRVVEHKRQYLTLEELKAAVQADCRYDVVKRAFIFACLTGLRWSDIQKMVWSEVLDNSDGSRIVFHQKKTKGLQYLDLSEQSRGCLGEPSELDNKVFTGLKYSSYVNVEISRWMMRAGISKPITFHCARHTFAMLQVSLGTDVFVLKELLGHSAIKTTMTYAKILDPKLKEAVNKIPDILL